MDGENHVQIDYIPDCLSEDDDDKKYTMRKIMKGYRPIAIQESILTVMHKILLKELPLP